MNYKNLFYFDIETVSKYKDISEFKELDKRGFELFLRKLDRKSDNYKDWKKNPDIVYKEKSPLMPEYGKIVCVSMAYYKDDDLKKISLCGDDEEKIINGVSRAFKNIGDNTTFGLCGYYIKGFDIPWLNRKMIKYDIEIPSLLKTFNIKPWDMNVYDLAEVWRTNGTLESCSFDEMLYEMDIGSPKDDISGRNVNDVYWIDNDINRIKDYCEKDVEATIKAAKKLTGLV